MLRGERVDAARNRQGILDAADRLFSETSAPEKISMEDVARAAGLGKGTLFRRFGDRATLIRSVYARRVEPLRRQIESGPPPLGPAAPRQDRVVAILPPSLAQHCGPRHQRRSDRIIGTHRTRRLHFQGPWRLPGPDSQRLANESFRSATS